MHIHSYKTSLQTISAHVMLHVYVQNNVATRSIGRKVCMHVHDPDRCGRYTECPEGELKAGTIVSSTEQSRSIADRWKWFEAQFRQAAVLTVVWLARPSRLTARSAPAIRWDGLASQTTDWSARDDSVTWPRDNVVAGGGAASCLVQGRSKRSGRSGFGRTTFCPGNIFSKNESWTICTHFKT